jgi:Heavy metal binding domain
MQVKGRRPKWVQKSKVRLSILGSAMAQGASVHICPMHSNVRQPGPGKCPECGMALLPEGTRFAMLRHMTSNPLHLVVMAALMVAVMAAVMMIWR